MAQSQIASVPSSGLPTSATPSMTEDALREIQQLQKIVQFHDAILAGSHPTIRAPFHSVGNKHGSNDAAVSSAFAFPSASGKSPQNAQINNTQSFRSNSQKSAVPGLGMTATSPDNASASRPFGAGNAEINPIFLEKSDDLIRAEIQLQRQRLDRALKEEVDQRRFNQKSTAQSEPLADFDIHDVFSKALTLVQATENFPPPVAATADAPAANDAAASDSFDENSYYSSQHNSSDFSEPSPRADKQSAAGDGPGALKTQANPSDPRAQDTVQSQLHAEPSSSYQPATYQAQGTGPAFAPSYGYPAQNPAGGYTASNFYQSAAPKADNAGADNNTTGESTSLGERSGEASRSDSANMMDVDQNAGRSAPSTNAGQARLGDSLLARPPSPLVIAQDLAPVAPQPSRVSPLAVSRQPAAAQIQTESIVPQVPTAQVAALRNEPNVVSSPDSSPQGARRNDKKKGKKKDRKDKKDKKAARQAPDIPYIKEEPRSPSPVSAPQFTRPQKRQKRQADNEQTYQAPERQPSRQYHEGFAPAPAPPVHYTSAEYYAAPRPASQVALPSGGAYSYQPEYVDDRRVSNTAQGYSSHYGPGEVYAPTSAPQPPPPPPMTVYERDPHPVYREPYEASRMSVRPEVSHPPSRSPTRRAPQPRIIVDAHGRRYYEPPPPTPPMVRHSVAPHMDDAEIIYERPSRAESRRPDYGDGYVVHRGEQSSASYAPGPNPQRRVITQPEYGSSDPHQQAYREHRDYSIRPPMPPPPPSTEQYAQVRSGADQQHQRRPPADEVPREYIMRATTARPAESVRYEMPRGDYHQQQPPPPPPPVPGYPTAGYPHGSQPPPQPQPQYTQHSQYAHPPPPPPPPRSYSVRPAEPHVVRRDFSSRPAEGTAYYGQQPVRAPEEDIAFIERPRGATQEIVYGDDARREIYHR